ncbi:MAG: ABC transporter permease [Candidatus Omnitrophica bacterium]|nr:ABC transporter permease [Candidatus Omnitrophota bacterium]MDD5552720.1 ABC transporter permease [Candidatus Omnitrophota bacterium]
MVLGRLGKIYFYRRALWEMSLKQFKARYENSILGVAWAVINPLLIMLAITFVFLYVFKAEIKNFSFFVLSGIFPWFFFSGALQEATFSILGQQSILRQFNLPREILPLSSVLSNFLNFFFGWLIIYPLFIFFNPKIVLLLPLFVLVSLLFFFFVCGLSLALSVLNVFFRDIGQLSGTLLMFWLWVTPVFYSIDMIPERFRWIYNFNPVVPYIASYQEVIFNGHMPNLSMSIGAFFWAFISLTSGLWVFLSLESKILKRI